MQRSSHATSAAARGGTGPNEVADTAADRTDNLNRSRRGCDIVDRVVIGGLAMNPSSLLNVSSDLLREHARLGMPTGPMATASDRSWAVGVCFAFAVAVILLVVALA